MKNLNPAKAIAFTALSLSIGVFIVACNKAGVKPANPAKPQVQATSEQNSNNRVSYSCTGMGSTMRMYWTVIEDCDVPSRNCFPDVIVNAVNGGYVNEFEDAIADGPSGIKDFFETGNGLELFEYLNCTEADEMYYHLVSEDYDITKIVNDNDESIYIVHPVDEPSEVDFVMVLK